MRPKSIVMFERLYLAGLAVSLISTALAWPQLRALAETGGMGTASLLGSMAIGVLIPLALWYMIARRASVAAKWLCVILFAIGLLVTGVSIGRGKVGPDVFSLLGIAALLLRMGAIAMLFQPDAKPWFAKDRA